MDRPLHMMASAEVSKKIGLYRTGQRVHCTKFYSVVLLIIHSILCSPWSTFQRLCETRSVCYSNGSQAEFVTVVVDNWLPKHLLVLTCMRYNDRRGWCGWCVHRKLEVMGRLAVVCAQVSWRSKKYEHIPGIGQMVVTLSHIFPAMTLFNLLVLLAVLFHACLCDLLFVQFEFVLCYCAVEKMTLPTLHIWT